MDLVTFLPDPDTVLKKKVPYPGDLKSGTYLEVPSII